MKLREWPISDNFLLQMKQEGSQGQGSMFVFSPISTKFWPCQGQVHNFTYSVSLLPGVMREEKKKCWRWPRPQQVNANWWRTDVSGLVCILYLQTAFASVSQIVHSSTHAKFPRISKGNMTADGQVASEGNVSEHRCNREPQKDLGCKELQRWSGANSPAMDTFH